MKNIIINGGNLIRKELYGVQRYAYEIMCELDKLVEPGKVQLVVPMSDQQFQFRNIEVVVLNKRIDKNRFSKLFWNHKVFPHYVKKNMGIGVDLTLGLPLSGCRIVAVHDCIVERFPDNAKTFREKLGRKFYMFRVKRVIKKCEYVITVSEFSKNDIEDIYGIPGEKIVVIPNAWQHYQRVKCDYSIIDKLKLNNGTPFFFSLGSRYYHKNFKWVIEAARQNPKYRFVVTGTNNLSSSDSDLNKEMPENVTFTGYLSDSKVKALMEKCKAFIQPSLYEGFGIPPLEAMSTGTHCIVSNASCLPEVYEKSVWYIDPKNYSHINIDKIIEPKIEDNDLILNKYSWEKSAWLFFELINKF